MTRCRIAPLVVALAAVVAACSGGGATAAPPATPSDDPSPSGASVRVEVNLTDALRIEPDPLVVPAGVPVTFVVTNTGSTDHEFFLGDEAAQLEHEAEMAEAGMSHDEDMGISVPPGETDELTVTFDAAGSTLAACHVAGHYQGGMQATVTIEG